MRSVRGERGRARPWVCWERCSEPQGCGTWVHGGVGVGGELGLELGSERAFLTSLILCVSPKDKAAPAEQEGTRNSDLCCPAHFCPIGGFGSLPGNKLQKF